MEIHKIMIPIIYVLRCQASTNKSTIRHDIQIKSKLVFGAEKNLNGPPNSRVHTLEIVDEKNANRLDKPFCSRKCSGAYGAYIQNH